MGFFGENAKTHILLGAVDNYKARRALAAVSAGTIWIYAGNHKVNASGTLPPPMCPMHSKRQGKLLSAILVI